MNRILGRMIIVLLMGLGPAALASSECIIPKVQGIQGEKVPFPFKEANLHFDLAENETYLIKGKVVVRDSKEFFWIDLEEQPWLATPQRVASPFYPLKNSASAGLKSDGKSIWLPIRIRTADPSMSGTEFTSGRMMEVLGAGIPGQS